MKYAHQFLVTTVSLITIGAMFTVPLPAGATEIHGDQVGNNVSLDPATLTDFTMGDRSTAIGFGVFWENTASGSTDVGEPFQVAAAKSWPKTTKWGLRCLRNKHCKDIKVKGKPSVCRKKVKNNKWRSKYQYCLKKLWNKAPCDNSDQCTSGNCTRGFCTKSSVSSASSKKKKKKALKKKAVESPTSQAIAKNQIANLFVPAKQIDITINNQLGTIVKSPSSITKSARSDQRLICDFSCSAFIPRHVVLELNWKDKKKSSRSGKADLRLDVSAMSNGFEEQNYGTIQLKKVPLANILQNTSTLKSADNNLLANRPQVLLRMVEAGEVIERAPNLPIFFSNNELNKAIARRSLSPSVLQAVQLDNTKGSLQQIRLFYKPVEEAGTQVKNNLTLEGLQPGLSYRFRLVKGYQNTPVITNHLVCRVPVCPADFVNEQ